MKAFRPAAATLSVVIFGGMTLTTAAALSLLAARWILAPAFSALLPDAQGTWWIAPAGTLLLVAAIGTHRLRLPRVAAAIAVALAALGAWALLQTYSGSGTDLLRVRLPTTALGRWVASERMTPTTAVLFVYLAGPFIAAPWIPKSQQRAVALATAGSIAILGAGSCLAGELLTILGWSGFNPLQGMGVTTATGFLGTGGAMVGMGFRRRIAPDPGEGLFDIRAASPIVGLALAALLSATLIAFQWADGERSARLRARFETATKDIVDDLGDRMPTYAMALRGSANFLERTGIVSRRDWAAHIRSLQVTSTFPGILGIGYLAYVTEQTLPHHLKQMRTEWSPAYKIYPPSARPDHAPVVLLEPDSERSRQVIGFDHLQEATRRMAIYAVRDSGQPSLSGTIVLVLDAANTRQFGFQMYMPVYRSGTERSTVEQRRRAFTGIVFSPFRFDELMHGILMDRYKGVRVRVLDGDPENSARLVYDSQRQADGSVWQSVPYDTLPVGALLLDHRWTILTSPQRDFLAAEPRVNAWILLGAGTLISVLFAAGIWQIYAVQSRELSLAEAQALNAEIENRLRVEQDLQAAREEARQRVEALNRELVKRAAALEIANRELEAFSYSVSHDLKQPVSGIAGYASMALEDFPQEMHPDVKDMLTHIQTASFRMNQLIDGLLALSSLSRAELRPEAVDLTRLAQETVDELRAAHPERDVEVAIAPGLSAIGDRKLLQVLINNLLGNAWKYSGKIAHARIEIGHGQTARGPAYFVKDNGAGFDMAKADRLFTAFHRLHSATEFPGTGIGLATVHRIVERHGGKIWAESQPGQGAQFFFTLGEEVTHPMRRAADRPT